MKRMFVLGALVAIGVLSLTVKAFQAQRPPEPLVKVVEAVKLRENLYILSGGGGTTGVFIRNDGVVVIDTKNPGWGQPILAKIKELTPKPVTMIINTHTHLDHVAGNVEFPASVDVVAQENTAANMKKIGPVTGLPLRNQEEYEIFPRNENRNQAKRTFKDRMTIGRGADQIDLYYFGRAHTSGDAWVVFPSLRVAHAGDMFAFKQPPIMDANHGGTGVGYPATLRSVHAGIRNVDAIINGHTFPGTTTWPELQEYTEYLTSFVDYVQSQNKAGRTVDEAAAAYKVPERFKGYSAPEPRVKANVQVIYDELKK